MQLTYNFLEELIDKGELETNEGKVRVFTELYVDQVEDLHQWKLIFQYKENFYQVPFVMCGGTRFNENLLEIGENELHPYINALSEKERNPTELVQCSPVEDRSIILTSEEADKLISESSISYAGEKINLTGPLYTDDEDYETFSYHGDSYGFSRDSVNSQGNIVCRTLPFIPALPFGVCGC